MKSKFTKIEKHVERLHSEGKIMRGSWGDGREQACYYSALVPGAKSTAACPAWLMPRWVADLLPLINDNVSPQAWPDITKRFVQFAANLVNMTPERWARALLITKQASLEIALPHNPAAVQPVLDLVNRALAGDEPSANEWAKAEAKAAAAAKANLWAWAAAKAASAAAARAASAAAWACSEMASWSKEAAWEKIAIALFDACA